MTTVLHAITLGLYVLAGGVYTTTLASGRSAVPRPGVAVIGAAAVAGVSRPLASIVKPINMLLLIPGVLFLLLFRELREPALRPDRRGAFC